MSISSSDREAKRALSLGDLFPLLAEQELRDAEESLRRYFDLAYQIIEEQSRSRHFDTPEISRSIKERSNSLKI